MFLKSKFYPRWESIPKVCSPVGVRDLFRAPTRRAQDLSTRSIWRKEDQMKKLVMLVACVIATMFLVSCESGQGFSGLDNQTAALDTDGVPDQFDNCPAANNAPDVSLGYTCVDVMDCLGATIPVATNALGSSPVGVYCVDGDCVIQADNDLDGAGDACDNDDDNDGVPDTEDNCVLVANSFQEDNDLDGAGDACDADDDNDGVPDVEDNCVLVANPNQSDLDSDGIGDACEGDTDGDGVLDDTDNCVMVKNPDQADLDSDGIGDLCDDDMDGDGVTNTTDNCPIVANADQSDLDTDEIGDLCDDDMDGDGVTNTTDNCPIVANADQSDLDTDGIGNVCDSDRDGDEVPNVADNCPDTSNADQADLDSDGTGDVCDPDQDGDGLPDQFDNCPSVANTDQADADDDGAGDACDADDDNDGIPDVTDNCPFTPNPDQRDQDADSIGNACDSDCDGDGVPEAELGLCDREIDSDGDGWLVSEGDCLEGNFHVYPGAIEACNGYDDNCDGIVDEGCSVCSEDADCDDDNACTDDACVEGECENLVAICNDNNPDTSDTCNQDTGCVFTCVPQCTERECGNNGCGGTCGSCTEGESCDATGICVIPTVEDELTVVWTKPATGVPTEVVKFLMSGVCFDTNGTPVVAWIDNPSDPKAITADSTVASVTGQFTAAAIKSCYFNVSGLNAQNVKVWWAVRDPDLKKSGTMSYSYNEYESQDVGVVSNGQGGGNYYFAPGATN